MQNQCEAKINGPRGFFPAVYHCSRRAVVRSNGACYCKQHAIQRGIEPPPGKVGPGSLLFDHKAPSGRIYEIETFTIAGGQLTSARARRGSWSQVIELTCGMGNHGAAACYACIMANKHDAATH